jgi:hypothetical protein
VGTCSVPEIEPQLSFPPRQKLIARLTELHRLLLNAAYELTDGFEESSFMSEESTASIFRVDFYAK